MIWHYNCPECGRETEADWKWLEKELLCPHCGVTHYPPTPHEDHYAYVDTPEWPPEIQEAVNALRGTVCAVPRCYRERSTLVHRKPLRLGGTTSVDNLVPMCAHHAESKSDRDYDEWLAEVREQEASQAAKQPQIEITITARGKQEPEPAVSFPTSAGLYVHITSGRPQVCAEPAVPKLLCRVPFLRGTMNRLLLDYDWEAGRSGLCHVYLLAWPRDQEPDFSCLGSPRYAWLFAVKDHLGVAGEKGTNQLELVLPDAPGGRWVAAAALLDEDCSFKLIEFAIAGST